MKKLLIGFALIFAFGFYARAQEAEPQTLFWKVFRTNEWNIKTGETSNVKEETIYLMTRANKLFWGKENVFTLSNRQVEKGEKSVTTTYDFVDHNLQKEGYLYHQSGVINEAAPEIRHVFMVQYHGEDVVKMYFLHDPMDITENAKNGGLTPLEGPGASGI